jgi:RNA polymerase sigma-32 factor
MKQCFESLKPQEVKAIAQELNVSERDVVEMESRFNGHEITLEPETSDEDHHFAPIAYLAADKDSEPDQLLQRAEIEHLETAGLAQALSNLDERSRRIIEARWLKEGDASTLHDLAAEFNVSAERIRQIEQKAMLKMRAAMAG